MKEVILEFEGKVLIIDDDPSITLSMKIWLESKGFNVDFAKTGKEALNILKDKDYDVALVDYRLMEMTGIELSEKLLEIDPNLKIIMITGFPSYETAVKAMKQGVFNYISKSDSNEEILDTIIKAVEARRKELFKREEKKEIINYMLLCNHSLIKESLGNLKDDKFAFNLYLNFPSINEVEEDKVKKKLDLVLICHTCNIKKFDDYFKIIPALQKDFSNPKIIILNEDLSDKEKVKLVRMGVKGIFKKNVDLGTLKEAIKKIHRGEMWISRKIISMALEDNELLTYFTDDEACQESKLTEREKEILNLIIKGFKNKEIAEKLFISEKTVKTHINKIFKKFKVKSRAQLIIKFFKDKNGSK